MEQTSHPWAELVLQVITALRTKQMEADKASASRIKTGYVVYTLAVAKALGRYYADLPGWASMSPRERIGAIESALVSLGLGVVSAGGEHSRVVLANERRMPVLAGAERNK